MMKNRRIRKFCNSGLTLLELLISIAIMGIIISVAMPDMSQFGANQRLIGAAEQVYGHLQQARSEAISRSSPVHFNFSANGSTTWTYGMSSANSLCNLAVTSPTTTGACVLPVDDGDGNVDAGDGSADPTDLVLMRFASTEYDDVAMNIQNFSSGTNQFTFDSVRGSSSSGEVNLTSVTGNQLRVAVNLLGRVTLCSPNDSVENYGTC